MSDRHLEDDYLSGQSLSENVPGKAEAPQPPYPEDPAQAVSDAGAVTTDTDLYNAKSDALSDIPAESPCGTAEMSGLHYAAPEEPAPAAPTELIPAETPHEEILPLSSGPDPDITVLPEPGIPVYTGIPVPAPATRSKGKGRKVLLAIIPVAIIAMILAFLLPTVILPEVQRVQAYNAAEEMLLTGMHDDAHNAFTALGDYRDARIMAMESLYRKAEYLSHQENYAEAISIWQELGSYSDSLARADQAEFDWKDEDYQTALNLMESGEFLEASRVFAGLDDYKDSMLLVEECQALQLDADYRAADAAYGNGDYESAIRQFQALGSYADAQERYRSANYEYGCLLLEQGKYERAILCFRDSSGYSDAREKITHANYLFGCSLLDAGKYEAAISRFEKCGNYLDASDNILKAKYGYVKANMARSNTTTQSYLKTLVAQKYPGAQNLYNELYAWKVEIIAYNNSPYSTVNQNTISKYGPMCIHFKVTGGEPGATINLVGNLTAPNGQSGNVYFNSCSDGDTLYATFEYYQPAYGATGTMTLRIYDENGKLMATASVRVTN